MPAPPGHPIATTTDDDEPDDGVTFVKSAVVQGETLLTHPRQLCPLHTFDATSHEKNVLHCAQCWCYVCQLPQSMCNSWSVHCNATHADKHWVEAKKTRAALSMPWQREETQS
jgi:hypothetical protein